MHDFDDESEYDDEDFQEMEEERLADIAWNCTCGAWVFNENKTQVFHVADCVCGAE